MAKGWTDPAQAHCSAPAPVLWGLQSSALRGKLRPCWVLAQDPSVLAVIAARLCPEVSPWQGHARERPVAKHPHPTVPRGGFGDPSAPTTLPVPGVGCEPPGVGCEPPGAAGPIQELLGSEHTEGDNVGLRLFPPLAGLVCRMLCGLPLQPRVIN